MISESLLSPTFLPKIDTEVAYGVIAQDILTSLNAKRGDAVMMRFDEPASVLTKALQTEATRRKVCLHSVPRDIGQVVSSIEKHGIIKAMAAFAAEEKAEQICERHIIISSDAAVTALGKLTAPDAAVVRAKMHQLMQRRIRGAAEWLGILPPTELDAQVEGLSFEEFERHFLFACNQPWKEIEEAQEFLCDKLNPGRELLLEAGEHTRLRMSIEDMTFINSTIARNYPGSEVFSAPIRESVQGTLFAPGVHLYDGYIFEDIYLKFVDGKVVECSAKKGGELLEQLLNEHPNSRYLGEVALGTNRGVVRKFAHNLLVEKMAGSFHVALGHCLFAPVVNGVKPRIDNGNHDTSLHWDIAVVMTSPYGGGRVILDGEVLQRNGFFVNPRLAILNPYPVVGAQS